MEQLLEGLPAGISVAIVLFGILTVILWTFLPFAVFGIKDRLDKLIKAQRETNSLLRKVAGVDSESGGW